jgi:hypothetical protein
MFIEFRVEERGLFPNGAEFALKKGLATSRLPLPHALDKRLDINDPDTIEVL